jgi:hypothetical protein
MNTIEMKTGGYAIYAPPALKKFLVARESGNASKELMMQLSVEAMAEQEAERKTGTLALRIIPEERGVVLDLDRARLERESQSTGVTGKGISAI